MSIVTKTGDHGTTALMFNRRVPKFDDRVEACGAVDELNSALGLARATVNDQTAADCLFAIQQDLISIMGELATIPEDLERYARQGYPRATPALTERLDAAVKDLEARHREVFRVGNTRSELACRGAGLGPHDLPPRRTTRMPASPQCRRRQPGDYRLSQPSLGFALVARARIRDGAELIWELRASTQCSRGDLLFLR